MEKALRFVSFITKPIILLHLILLIQWSIFLGSVLQPYSSPTPGRTYNLLRGHLIYTSLIREGRDGAWKTTITHTTRPVSPLVVHTFFIFLGKLSALFHVDPPIMYMASRMAAAVILFWSTYWFVTVVLPKQLHALALFFILAIEPGPMLTSLGWNLSSWRPSIFSYYPQIVSLRHFGLPHHTMGEAVGLLVLTLLFITIQKPTWSRFIWLGILTIIGANILPPYFMILCICILVPWSLWALCTRSVKSAFFPITLTVASVAVVSLFLQSQLSKGYPSKDFNQDEKHWVSNPEVLISYLSTLLLYIPGVSLIWISCLTSWKKLNESTKLLIMLMTSWTLIPPLLVPISNYPWFPIANFRLMDGYNYVPAGILTTLGMHYGLRMLKHKELRNFLFGFIISATVICTGYLSYSYTNIILSEQSLPWSNVYLLNDHYKAFKFLETVPKMSGLMVSNHFGEITPEFAPVRSYIGSTPGFVDWQERQWIMNRFYSVGFTTQEASDMLKREDISYVYYGDSEKVANPTGIPLYPELLTPVFESPGVTVYKVKPKE